jgi:DNA-binding Lrp family transcriptional regulator
MMGIGHNGGPRIARDYGWVAIARAMRGHPLVGFHLFAKPCDANRGAMQPALAFIDLIMECQYEDGTVVNGGKTMTIQRGQLIGAVSWLAQRWNWTPMAVRTWLDKLEADGIIQRNVPGNNQNNKHHGKVATVITLCKYDEYQSGSVSEQHTKQQITQPTAQQTQQQQYKDNHSNQGNNKKDYGHEGQSRGRDYWSNAMAVPGAYNPDEGVLRDPTTGALTLVNGTRQLWLERFGDAESLDLALLQAAAYVQPNAYKPLKVQIEAQLAKQLAGVKERGKRYEAAKQSKPQPETPEQRKKRLFAQAQEEMRGRK